MNHLQILPYLTEHFPTTFERFHHPVSVHNVIRNSNLCTYIFSCITSPVPWASTLYMTFASTTIWVPSLPTSFDFFHFSYLLSFVLSQPFWREDIVPMVHAALHCWSCLYPMLLQIQDNTILRQVVWYLVDYLTAIHPRSVHLYDSAQLSSSPWIWWKTHTCKFTLSSGLVGESLGVRFSTYVQRWYINGEVKCFQGSHAPLAFLAIIVLALCVTAIPLLSVVAFDRIQVI